MNKHLFLFNHVISYSNSLYNLKFNILLVEIFVINLSLNSNIFLFKSTTQQLMMYHTQYNFFFFFMQISFCVFGRFCSKLMCCCSCYSQQENDKCRRGHVPRCSVEAIGLRPASYAKQIKKTYSSAPHIFRYHERIMAIWRGRWAIHHQQKTDNSPECSLLCLQAVTDRAFNCVRKKRDQNIGVNNLVQLEWG